MARTIRSLLVMIALGIGLAVYNAVTVAHDVATATGPKGEAQHDFFVAAADRPDIELFYKGLSHSQKLAMARKMVEYGDPKLASLIGKLLGTFDAEARQMLTASLTTLGRQHPDAVASQLPRPGSLQQFAITTALRRLGPGAVPSVIDQFKSAEARPNAISYIVSVGKPAVPLLLPLLDSEAVDVRLAAADALGKIGAGNGVQKLIDLYRGASGDARFAYLSALSGIGAKETEPLLSAAVDDEELTTPQKAQAMLGLGRVGTKSAIEKLWSFADSDDPQVRESVVSALRLAGPPALAGAPDPVEALRVAAGISGPASDSYIGGALKQKDSKVVAEAARASNNRPGLVTDLVQTVYRLKADQEVSDLAIRALSTTPAGIEALKGLIDDPAVGGLAFRRLRLLGIRQG